MIQIIGVSTFRDNLGSWYGNLCTTLNGTMVTRRGLGYYKVNKDGIVTNKKLFYVGQENGKEIWKREVKNKDGEYYFRTEYKEVS